MLSEQREEESNWSQRYDMKFREFSAPQCCYENTLLSGSHFFTAKGVVLDTCGWFHSKPTDIFYREELEN
jgi:hypothetical protein